MDRVQLWCVHVVQVFVAAVGTEFETYFSALSTHSFCFSYYFLLKPIMHSCERPITPPPPIPFYQFHNNKTIFSFRKKGMQSVSSIFMEHQPFLFVHYDIHYDYFPPYPLFNLSRKIGHLFIQYSTGSCVCMMCHEIFFSNKLCT